MISYLIPKVEPTELSTENGIGASGTIALESDIIISKYNHNHNHDNVAQKRKEERGGPSIEIVEFMPKCQLFPHYEAKLRYGKSEEERKHAYEMLLEHFSDIIVDEPCRQALKSYILKPESDEEREAEERAILLEREKLQKEKEIEVIDLTVSSDDEDDEKFSSIRVSTSAPVSEPPVLFQPEPSVPQPKPLISQPKPLISQPKPLVPQPKPLIYQPKPLVSQPKPLIYQPKPLVSQPKLLFSQPKPLILQPELSVPTNAQVLVPQPPVAIKPEPLVPQIEPLVVPQHSTRRSTRVFVPSAKLINATVDNLSTVEQKLLKRTKQQQQRNQQQKRTTQPKVQPKASQPQQRKRKAASPEQVKAKKRLANLKYREKVRLMKEAAKQLAKEN